MGLFDAAHKWGGKNGPSSLKSITRIMQWQRIKKRTWIKWHITWVLLKSAFFHQKPADFLISKITDVDCVLNIYKRLKHFLSL